MALGWGQLLEDPEPGSWIALLVLRSPWELMVDSPYVGSSLWAWITCLPVLS